MLKRQLLTVMCLAAMVSGSAMATPITYDDFNDTTIDSNLWTTGTNNQNYPAFENGGVLRLYNVGGQSVSSTQTWNLTSIRDGGDGSYMEFVSPVCAWAGFDRHTILDGYFGTGILKLAAVYTGGADQNNWQVRGSWISDRVNTGVSLPGDWEWDTVSFKFANDNGNMKATIHLARDGFSQDIYTYTSSTWEVSNFDFHYYTKYGALASDYLTVEIPEPATMTLLAVGGGLVLFRRKR